MKRTLAVTIGIVCILLVLAVWVYLMLFGTPEQSNDVFTNLGFDITSREVVPTPQPEPEVPYVVDTDSSDLVQLTTRPVAGFIAFTQASSSVVRYAEQGTGHIYQIDLASGIENLVSRTTIPRVREAYFDPSGRTVALVSIDGYNKDAFLGLIDENNQALEGESLAPNAENVWLPNVATVQYTLTDQNGTIGYQYDLGGTQVVIFSTPFTAITVNWDEAPITFYNKPAEDLRGYLYEVVGGSYQSTPYHGYAFVSKANETSRFVTESDGDNVTTTIYIESERVVKASTIAVPEKCTFELRTFLLWCGTPLVPDRNYSLNEWYKGERQSDDYILSINLDSGSVSPHLNLEKETNRPIDVTKLTWHESGKLFFTNKIDSSLWSYRISR